MFKRKKKDKDKIKVSDKKDKKKKPKESKSNDLDKELLESANKLFPISKEEEDNLNKNKTFDPNNSEFEVWRAVKSNTPSDANNNSNNNEHLVLTEYLEKLDNSTNDNDSENLLKNKKVLNHQKSHERLILIEDYFDRDNQDENENNNNLDEVDSDNSDKEISQKIQNIRENENDDDDDDNEITKSGSKKVINNKSVEMDENSNSEYPSFYAECKYYGENKERYQVKISIDSSFNIVFTPDENNNFKLYNSNYYTFPLLAIKNYITTKKNKKYVIDIILKDYRSYSFKLTADDYIKFNKIIKEFGKPNQSINYFRHAYYYYSEYSKIEKDENYIDGWTIYDDEDEFRYQDLDFDNTFRVIDNSKFDFCSSYPKKIVVPISMTDEDIKKCATYRTKERFPALTYRYKKNGKCIWRSSQTKSGIKGKTNKDVILLTKIAEGSEKLYVFDARPLLNAWANKLKGAGYEDTSQYTEINMELLFCGIPNIHAVRGSCHKVYSTLCFKNEKNEEKKTKAKNNMDSGNWYDSIIILIKGAFQISEAIKNDSTVLIHCSDGWDRTTQLSCTSQLILDKRFRTIDGFICLIEKDWLTFGHQFRYRLGMYSPSDSPSHVASENQKSPVFIQWLDAVYQIMIQNIIKFEFNTDLLFFLANEIFTGKYGTFLFNNEKEREEYNAREKTVSVWSYVKENEYRFINPIYNPDDNSPFVMNYKRVQLWSKYFFRFEDGDNNYNEEITKVVNNLNNVIKKDKEMINDLVNFINKKCSGVDISSLKEECQTLIKKKQKIFKK